LASILKLQQTQCDFMAQLCIMDYTACEYFTHGNGLYERPFRERIAKSRIYFALLQSETGKAIAPFIHKIAPRSVF
jgi:hypothetical protein